MSAKSIVCTYKNLIDASNKDAPIEVEGEFLVVSVENLRKGMYYVVPLYFWSQDPRPVRVEILKPGTKSTVMVQKDFTISRNLDDEGKDQWTNKRYRLDSSRHNGQAIIRIGWPSSETEIATCPFKVIAAPLTSKALKKQQRIDSGQCPECGKEGEWIQMAMVCRQHGVFLG